jgi:hypothetical protein
MPYWVAAVCEGCGNASDLIEAPALEQCRFALSHEIRRAGWDFSRKRWRCPACQEDSDEPRLRLADRADRDQEARGAGVAGL